MSALEIWEATCEMRNRKDREYLRRVLGKNY